MATGKFLAQDVYFAPDGHDLSNFAFRMSTPSERERIDVSGFNPNGTKEFLAGDKEDSVEVGLLQSFATGGPHDILSDLYQNQTVFGVRVRPTSSAVSSSNPELSGQVQILSYNGLDAEKGNRAEISVTLIPADEDGLTWANT